MSPVSLALIVLLGFVAMLLAAEFATTERSAAVDKDRFENRLVRLAGPSALRCADASINRRQAADLSCMQRAMAGDRPWIAVVHWDGFGHGRVDWIGYVRDRVGAIWVVDYGPDAGDGSEAGYPRQLTVRRCRQFRLTSPTARPLFCG